VNLLAGSVTQQMEDIGADLQGVRIPTLVPVAVPFPGGVRPPMAMRLPPRSDGRVSLRQTRVRTKMNRVRHLARRQLRAMHPIAADSIGKTLVACPGDHRINAHERNRNAMNRGEFSSLP